MAPLLCVEGDASSPPDRSGSVFPTRVGCSCMNLTKVLTPSFESLHGILPPVRKLCLSEVIEGTRKGEFLPSIVQLSHHTAASWFPTQSINPGLRVALHAYSILRPCPLRAQRLKYLLTRPQCLKVPYSIRYILKYPLYLCRWQVS